MKILDRAKLEAVSCECYASVRAYFNALRTPYGKKQGTAGKLGTYERMR